ncbi:MAG: OmpA family protein [Burkholderiaceae bacterium]
MNQQGVLVGGAAAFALLCAFSVWWIGPHAASRDALPNAKPLAARPRVEPAASPTPVLPPVAQKTTPTPAPTPTPAALPTVAAPGKALPSPVASPSLAVVAQTTAPGVATAREVEVDIAKQLQGKTIEFESKSDQLTARGKEVLDGLLPLFAKAPAARFLIEGHTDSWGEPAYNLALSERRARSVQAYLVSKGLNAQRLEAKGVGDARPIADNKTTAGSRKNRRIEFKAL